MTLDDIKAMPGLAKRKYDQMQEKLQRMRRSRDRYLHDLTQLRQKLKTRNMQVAAYQRGVKKKRIVMENSTQYALLDFAIKACEHWYPGFGQDQILSRSRKCELVEYRQVLASLLSLKMTLKKTGQMIGGRDHSTIVHCRQSISDRCDVDSDFNKKYEAIRHRFYEIIRENLP